MAPTGWWLPRREPAVRRASGGAGRRHDTTVGLPRSIQVLLTARLEALPSAEGEVVEVAAVAGRDFPVAAVEALTGRAIEGEARPSRAA